MSVVNALKEEIKELETLRIITNTMMDINSIKIKKIRSSFERNRRYFEEIEGVYHLINASLKNNKGVKMGRKTDFEKKRLRVAVTSNYHFYGQLNANVMKQFEAQAADGESELMVIGRTGISWAINSKNLKNILPVRFSRDFPASSEITSFIKGTEIYEQVLVFYPQFESVVNQNPVILDITARITESESSGEKQNIIFEPEIEKISEFFDKQVRTILFQRVMLETELSRTAARLMAAASATDKNEEYLKKRRGYLAKAVKALQNSRLLETFSMIVKREYD